MKTGNSKPTDQAGLSMVLCVVFLALGSLVLAGVVGWCATSSRETARYNEYLTTVYTAEAAVEQVRASMSYDYLNQGEASVSYRLPTYQQLLPSASDPYWANYSFVNPNTGNPGIIVYQSAAQANIVMDAPYQGMTSVGSKYQVIANVRNTNSSFQIPVSVGIELNLARLPLFQFAMFADPDMEVNPGPNMMIGGVVHGNSDIYVSPGASLVFSNDVSASGHVYLNPSPLDPSGARGGTSTFKGARMDTVPKQNLPVGTNQTDFSSSQAQNVHAILEVPPPDEPYAYNSIGTNRYYNKADLILKVTDSGIVALSGVAYGNSHVLSNFPASTILNTADTFYDKREGMQIQATAVDIGKLKSYSQTNTELKSAMGGNYDISTLYIVDQRNTNRAVVTTNSTTTSTIGSYTTNTTPATNVSYPTSGTYLGSVASTTIQTNSTTAPAIPPASNVSSNNTQTTTSSAPSAGTYLGSVTTNSTPTTTSSRPAAGTYVGTITTNYNGNGSIKNYTYNKISNYTYNKITSYTYYWPAYTYNLITGIATNWINTTNFTYTTNIVPFAKPAIVLTNGATLPNHGLTIATPDPVYIKGDYNTSVDGVNFYTGTSDTSHTRPAAVLCDAINILSKSWNNANSSNSISYRTAASTTVNAAFLAGNVPSDGVHYSGGMENFPRFLENWSGKTFTYNGSMVLMFPSQIGTGFWGSSDVYSAPTRNWTFDRNFLGTSGLPPAVPQSQAVSKGRWMILPFGSTTLPSGS